MPNFSFKSRDRFYQDHSMDKLPSSTAAVDKNPLANQPVTSDAITREQRRGHVDERPFSNSLVNQQNTELSFCR